MNFRRLFFVAVTFFQLFSCAQKDVIKPSFQVVRTEGGFISGTHEDSVHIFKGVPFAAPPVGDLRWQDPKPVRPWSDTLACYKFAASPMQNDPKPFMMWTEEFISPPQPLSEDCLYLNIWSGAHSADERLPVLVWIYGGGFNSGSSACAVYDGKALAKQGIIYVSLNYRVGVFGFMAHPDLTKESQHQSSGNYGLMDQIAALKWIRNNIASFGGDPEKVTIAGQSAGSFSVQALVASPLTKGLFRGAIAQSGAMTRGPAMNLQTAEKIGSSLSERLNTSSVSSLRELSADSMLSLASTLPFGSLFPVVDGYVVPEDMNTIFAKKQQQDVAVMAGWVTGDAALATRQHKSAKDFRENAKQTYKERSSEFLNLFPADTEESARSSQEKLGILTFAALGDYTWAISNPRDTYIYQYSYVPTDKPDFPNYGAFHTSEVPFALHTLAHWQRPWKQSDYDVEKYMSAYWLNFVKTGNPNGEGLPEWKKFDPEEGVIMELGARPESKSGLYKSELTFLSAQ
ncbi:MAG TPA: carboxylesterase family protein [Chryseolinea sp.]